MYLTFGSDKTVTKDAEDSYGRYAMAMKHYNQIVCDKDIFIQGYNDVQSKKTKNNLSLTLKKDEKSYYDNNLYKDK